MSLLRAEENRKVVLLTGACSGIGLEMAKILASLGYTLILVSHRGRPLDDATESIRSEHGATVYPIVKDLARPEAATELFSDVSALGLSPDILINNAGMFFFGEAADCDLALANRLLQLHVVTPSLLCSLFARGMRERRRGHLLIVSSISAFRDFPGISYYGSSKKYLRGFAGSLRSELGPYGVSVTCLCPGATATGLYDPSVVPVDLAKRLGVMMDPNKVAEAGLSAMFAGEAESVPGALTRVMAAAAVATPQPVIDLLRRYGPWMKKDR